LPVLHIAGEGLIATPGFIDPHQHLIGGSGESGFASQTPEVFLQELVQAGITSVVGCLGVDTWTRTIPALLAKVKGLRAQGISAFAWSGGYPLPPVTLTGSVAADVLYVEEIIGAGEIAIADLRASHPDARDLARLVAEVRSAGLLSSKAGVTHFHVGSGRERLNLLHRLLNEFEVDAACLYPTHVERSKPLMREAIERARRGSFVDIDTYDEDLALWTGFYLENGGDPGQLTISSDAAINSPQTLIEQLRACVRAGQRLEVLLPFATANTAHALKLNGKGRLGAGMDADLLLLKRADLQLTHVIARGALLMDNGRVVAREAFLEKSNRKVSLHGSKEVEGELA
jgi:beta-aspartyl-dipeptidase (metallo-type)